MKNYTLLFFSPRSNLAACSCALYLLYCMLIELAE